MNIYDFGLRVTIENNDKTNLRLNTWTFSKRNSISYIEI